MVRQVVFAPEARDDLLSLYDHIAMHANGARAKRFTVR
jgi:plasmid stabilization system protein ParE